MGETAVAYRYAEALYELAREKGRQEPVLASLAGFKAALDAEPGIWSRIFDPRAEREEKERLLRERLPPDVDELVVNAVRLLLARNRLGILDDFFRVYLEVHERGEGILRVGVETASPLSEEESSELERRLGEATGKRIVLEPEVDPSLLGGVRLVVDSRVVDGSLRSRLERIKRRMKAAHVG